MMRRAGFAVAWLAATLVSMFIATQAVSGVSGQVTDKPSPLPEATAAALSLPTAAEVRPGSNVPGTAVVVASPGQAATATGSTATVAPPASAPATPAAGAPPPVVTSPATSEPSGSAQSADPDDPPSAPSATVASTTTTTTSPPPPSTTTAPFEYAQYYLAGGFVELKYRPNEVYLVAATPQPGYEVSVDKSGPDGVEVEFEAVDEGDSYEGELRAEWRDGTLDVEIDEHSDDD